ncbi:DoxX family protein [Actinopolymorpha sp. B11F2]|uniref:DoxX family protein n=1 Tax=Actinopolymorpha sp. B11F2 TaxID=3160862 RepID=UPI0032E4C084
MTASHAESPTPASRPRAVTIALWAGQILLGVFFVAAAAVPKLVGDQIAVEMFDHIGLGQWFRYLVGILELAGGIGLLIPRLAGLAALGLVGVMVGATFTSVFVLDAGITSITPAILGVLVGLIAWARWSEVKALLALVRAR